MKQKIISQDNKPYTVLVDEMGRKWICDLGVNDQGYLSAQHCFEVHDPDIVERITR